LSKIYDVEIITKCFYMAKIKATSEKEAIEKAKNWDTESDDKLNEDIVNIEIEHDIDIGATVDGVVKSL